MGIPYATNSLGTGDHRGISRRQFGILGGAAGIDATGVFPATAHGRVVLGANRKDFPSFRRDIPLARAVRVYYDGENNIPDRWPDGVAGSWVTASICPNPRDLLAG